MRQTLSAGFGLILLAGCAAPAPAPRLGTPAAPAMATDQADHPTFAGVRWGTRLPAVRAALEGHGFAFRETDGDGDHVFEGELLGYPTRLWAFMGGAEVVKLQVVIITPDEDAIDAFGRMTEILRSKYGPARDHREWYDEPYRSGDGRSEEAIRAGKGSLAVAYEGLWMEVAEDLVVLVNYESPSWSDELDRRRTAAALEVF